MLRRRPPLADWARASRIKAGYTSAEAAAAAAGLKPGYVRAIEVGHIGSPDPDRLARLEELYASTAPASESEDAATLRAMAARLERMADALDAQARRRRYTL